MSGVWSLLPLRGSSLPSLSNIIFIIFCDVPRVSFRWLCLVSPSVCTHRPLSLAWQHFITLYLSFLFCFICGFYFRNRHYLHVALHSLFSSSFTFCHIVVISFPFVFCVTDLIFRSSAASLPCLQSGFASVIAVFVPLLCLRLECSFLSISSCRRVLLVAFFVFLWLRSQAFLYTTEELCSFLDFSAACWAISF